MKSPFPYFGGKARIASEVWRRFGNVRNYVEPFAGSLAVLLNARWPSPRIETVNDLDGWLSNFWRALSRDPEAVAKWADYPVSELDLHARGDWLFYRDGAAEFIERLRSDPDYFCAKSAGWWVWGLCSWIGSGWGPMMRDQGKERQRPHLGTWGADGGNQGIHRERSRDTLTEYLSELGERMRRVRICCGDWSRVCGPSVTFKHGLTGVFLDPPYATEDRHECYVENSFGVAHEVREWCRENGDNREMRIALCGYEGEHNSLESEGWLSHSWKARGGFDGQNKDRDNDNRTLERCWFSPHCLVNQRTLFSSPMLAETLT